ncbi:ABC transporter ATP-binding protein [Chitinophaga oryzae]|uniref:ABC transporter ATP-binding protein n=1 Tax=Chitinophaga oryzae TaxID=2725414 RepID=A0AAE7D7G1_9BACT|nr:ABC transporter ATP-binding protein [Chitinophaga oryzae]QJB32206.1 ABC transporter ATP-binding protein [Chitinophaga oryzae]
MRRKDYLLFFSYVYPYWFRELLMFALMLLGTAAGLASPYALKVIIDQNIPEKDYAGMLLVLGALLLIYVLRMFIGFLSDYIGTWIANKVVHDIKQNLFHSLLQQPYIYFDHHNPGDIIQVVNQEIHKIQQFLTSSFLRLSYNLFSIAGLSFMLFFLYPALFLIALSVLPFPIVLNRVWNKKIKMLVGKISTAEAGIFNFYIDRIKNVKVIRNYNAAGTEQRQLVSRLDRLFGLYLQSASYSSLSRNVSGFFIMIGPLIMLAYGGYQVIAGLMTTGTLVAFIQYMNRLYTPSSDIFNFYTDFVNARVSMERILPLLKKQGTAVTDTPAPLAGKTVDSLELENISFSYETTMVIRHLSAGFYSGRSYALVGLNGAGKSTLLKLLCRFYPLQDGNITVNGATNLGDIDMTNWNDYVNIVHQEPLLFAESIRFNVAYGNTTAADADIWRVLEAADINAFVAQLPAGLDTVLGEGKDGIILSGGQRQQLVIARALLRGGQVLVLDEATSAVDGYREQKILSNILRYYRKGIVISISHRLSSIRDLDEILVLHNGSVAEKGTHAELVNARGYYYEIFEHQLNNESATVR